MSGRRRRGDAAPAGARWPLSIAVAGLIGSFAYGWFVLVPTLALRTQSPPPAAASTTSKAHSAGPAALSDIGAPDERSAERAPAQRPGDPVPASPPGDPASAEPPDDPASAESPGDSASAILTRVADHALEAAGAAPAADPCAGAMAAALGNARVEFRSASTEILPASRNVISVLAALAHVCAGEIAIAGHSDDLGPEDVNEQLSLERAQAVAAAFIAFGIEPQRLRSRGYGSSRPVADNATPAGRARNRRIEMSFITGESAEQSE